MVAPHPQALVSPSSFVNIANNYSHSAMFRYQAATTMAGRTFQVLPFQKRSGVCLINACRYNQQRIHRCFCR